MFVTTLFDGEDIRVVIAPQDDRRLLVVSFTGRDHKPPAPTGAGAGFLSKNAIDAVHVISKKNHWWNTVEWPEALGAISAYAVERRTEELVTYGSSMGGHGALVASRLLGAARVVAYAPQFSVDPQIVPWETRWASDTSRIAFVGPTFAQAAAAQAIYIFSDPFFAPDQHHVDAILHHVQVQHMRVTFSEHDVSRVLSDCELLSSVTLKALRGMLSEGDFTRTYRAKRNKTALVYGGASRLLHKRGRDEAALAFARHGFAMLTGAATRRTNAEFDRFVLGFLDLLIYVNAPEEALSVVARWCEADCGSRFAFERCKAQALRLSERLPEALEAVDRAMAERPTERTTHMVAADILELLGDREKTLMFFRKYERDLLRYPAGALAFGGLLRHFDEALGADVLRRSFEQFPAHAKLSKAVKALG